MLDEQGDFNSARTKPQEEVIAGLSAVDAAFNRMTTVKSEHNVHVAV